jgi:hypothetical protein
VVPEVVIRFSCFGGLNIEIGPLSSTVRMKALDGSIERVSGQWVAKSQHMFCPCRLQRPQPQPGQRIHETLNHRRVDLVGDGGTGRGSTLRWPGSRALAASTPLFSCEKTRSRSNSKAECACRAETRRRSLLASRATACSAMVSISFCLWACEMRWGHMLLQLRLVWPFELKQLLEGYDHTHSSTRTKKGEDSLRCG